MALYLGGEKVKLNLDRIVYNLCLLSPLATSVPSNLLISYDNYILRDANELYLTVKEDE